jgi:2-polyprenyl-3-methyl-5-hydroxy-6-metoxy-1,4-benzoquinol methylase
MQEQYVCVNCQRRYPVIDQIPRFLTDLAESERQIKRSFDLEHDRYIDSRHQHFSPKLVEQWLDLVQLPREFFKGKLVLDAGCGAGRWTYAMASLGARVVAVDLTDAGVKVTYDATATRDNVVVLQANIFQLPFKEETFDFVVSWGVLHHTRDTKAAFDRVVPLVKKGGQFYVMVYERHNPFKFVCTNLLRRVLQAFPEERRYQLCRLLIIKNRWLYALLMHRIICVPYPKSGDPLDVATCQLGLYDAYSPVFNHLHSRQEVERWFREHGFREICLTKPVLFTSKREVRLSGECGGSVNMRGVRA